MEEQEELVKKSVQLFNFIVYESIELYENEIKNIHTKISQIDGENLEFELLILKSFILDYVVSTEPKLQSVEKEMIIEVYYYHLEKFLTGAEDVSLPSVEEKLKGYAEALVNPLENNILLTLSFEFAKRVLKNHSKENYEVVITLVIYILNDLIKEIYGIIETFKKTS